MTLNEFFKEVRKIKGWRMYKDGSIRYRAGHAHNLACCPITAVVYKKTKNYYMLGEFPFAAKSLGLSDRVGDIADDIVHAADNSLLQIKETFEPWEVKPALNLRRRLLRATGLTDNSTKKKAA